MTRKGKSVIVRQVADLGALGGLALEIGASDRHDPIRVGV